MRKLSLLAAAGLLAPIGAHAKPLNELLLEKGAALGAESKDAGPGRVTYNKGTVLEVPSAGFSMKLNVGVQEVASFNDPEDGEDTFSFDTRNTRLDLRFTGGNGTWGGRVLYDFTKNSDNGGGATLQDGYLSYTPCEGNKFVFGQWATGHGSQWNIENQNLEFVDRSLVTDAFTFGRQEGVGYQGNIGDTFSHQLAIYNGNSTVNGSAEGQNTGGLDNKVFGVYNAALDLVGDYDWSYEGDPTGADFSMGLSASGYYGQGEVSGLTSGGVAIPGVDFDQYGAGVGLAARGGGFAFAAEGFYQGVGLDIDSDNDTFNNFGAYAQLGYFIVPESLDIAGRFGWISFDEDAPVTLFRRVGGDTVTDVYEVNVVVGYYIMGHQLKVITGPKWLVADTEGSDDITDFSYEAGIFGYM